MLRFVLAGLITLAVLGVARLPRGEASEHGPSATPSSAEQPTSTPLAHRPGEPSLLLDATVLNRDASGHFTAAVAVNGQPVDMVVDTGATAVALSIPDAERIGVAFDRAQFRVVGTGASGPVHGQAVTLDDVAVGGRHVTAVEAVVLEGLDRSLLGQSYLRRLERVEISGDTMSLR